MVIAWQVSSLACRTWQSRASLGCDGRLSYLYYNTYSQYGIVYGTRLAVSPSVMLSFASAWPAMLQAPGSLACKAPALQWPQAPTCCRSDALALLLKRVGLTSPDCHVGERPAWHTHDLLIR